LKISLLRTRTLYFTTPEDQSRCFNALLHASKDDLTRKEDISLKYSRSGKILGAGSFGQVEVYIHLKTLESFAVKTVKKSKESPFEDIEALNEYFILRSLSHPYVIKVKEIFETDTSFKIVMEFIEGTHLAKYLFTRPRLEDVTKQIIFKFFQGLQYLHKEGIAHRDIKLENLMIVSRVG
jgi:serine/threonine protein kinase